MRALFVWKKERNMLKCEELCWEHKNFASISFIIKIHVMSIKSF